MPTMVSSVPSAWVVLAFLSLDQRWLATAGWQQPHVNVLKKFLSSKSTQHGDVRPVMVCGIAIIVVESLIIFPARTNS